MQEPQRLQFTVIDFLKALYCWIMAFRQTFSVQPGLYYLGGQYDKNTPLLVTCNYHLTVFILWRTLKNISLRLLVIDTGGINVWCSSGGENFCSEEIMKQLNRYNREILSDGTGIEIVLPKLSLSGVCLEELKDNSVVPHIGPVYASKIPEYLNKKPLKDCISDKFEFSLRDRLFTLVPSSIQFLKYMLLSALILFAGNYFTHSAIYWQTIPIGLSISLLYILFFPFLPTKTFSIKGLFLFFLMGGIFSLYNFTLSANPLDSYYYLFYMLFTAGTSVFFALYYTGNSGVSNYSLVKREIMNFLPAVFFLYLLSLAVLIIKGVKG